MKKLLQLLAIPALFAAAFVVTGSTGYATAQTNCQDIVISNTGAGSNNQVLCNGEYKITINCSNNTQAVLNVSQDAQSGNAIVTGNTNSGDAVSGEATNESELDAIIDNSCELDDDDKTPEPETPETPAPTEPTAPEGEVQGEATVAALPETGSMTPLQAVALIASAALAVILTGRLVVTALARGQQ